ncbi:T9SS type A sorting domain-containing protein [Pontibacter silvestris]|uniref:T9SS type A sorting domain-containing protein n=1 Tax=Pontibacter silvestris TaxID=2305183 RepID=A0ABW4WYF8_9BACT|nr:T9SS type A sorting domain-containing protein [Pontibacter silvestris]MCC9135225.1 T9SS type A sorting domain-containing protein [Pontibacter silvestris]
MKKKQKNMLRLLFGLGFTIFSLSAKAQATGPDQADELTVNIIPADPEENAGALSGINLYPTKEGNYNLHFEQNLNEDAVLEISNTKGRVVYQKPLKVRNKRKSWHYDIGKIKPDTYLVTVRTSDTTYWSRFRVSN